jgi:SAF domain
MTSGRLLRLGPSDNVYIATARLSAGDVLEVGAERIRIHEDIDIGHKVAAASIGMGEAVVRYGMPIGRATHPISVGDWVHTHNLASNYIKTFAHRGGGDENG